MTPADWPAPTPDQTILYGIGAQKAATTWLTDQLGRHADVHIPERKELQYWSTVRAPYSNEMRFLAKSRADYYDSWFTRRALVGLVSSKVRHERDEARALNAMMASTGADHSTYLRYLARHGTSARILGDVTPRYALLSAKTFAEMHAAHPNTRFVMVLRDPVDRLASGMRQSLRRALSSSPSQADVLLTRAAEEAVSNPLDPNFLRSNYVATLKALAEAVPAEHRLVLFFEHLSQPDTATQLQNLLGLDQLTLDSSKVVYGGVAKGWQMSDALRQKARSALAGTYDYIYDTFGDAVPKAWMPPAP